MIDCCDAHCCDRVDKKASRSVANSVKLALLNLTHLACPHIQVIQPLPMSGFAVVPTRPMQIMDHLSLTENVGVEPGTTLEAAQARIS